MWSIDYYDRKAALLSNESEKIRSHIYIVYSRWTEIDNPIRIEREFRSLANCPQINRVQHKKRATRNRNVDPSHVPIHKSKFDRARQQPFPTRYSLERAGLLRRSDRTLMEMGERHIVWRSIMGLSGVIVQEIHTARIRADQRRLHFTLWARIIGRV